MDCIAAYPHNYATHTNCRSSLDSPWISFYVYGSKSLGVDLGVESSSMKPDNLSCAHVFHRFTEWFAPCFTV